MHSGTKYWIGGIAIAAAVFAAWFALGVLTFDDDPEIEQAIVGAAS
jgi:hypothetical protein